MSGGLRVALFVGMLGAVFVAAVGVGAAVDPDSRDDEQASKESGGAHGETGRAAKGGHGDDGHGAAGEGGLRLVAAENRFAAGEPTRFDFEIEGDDGRTVKDYDVEHERRMHLIVVRRDLTGFQHLHPKQNADGSWSTPLTFATGGTHRVFADFASKGKSQTLSADVEVAGDYRPRELPHPETTAATDSGYEVRLGESGSGETRFTVFDATGTRVKDVEPYLGARGHLVALREGDLEFLHVHPVSEATEGSDIRFEVEYPSDGRYRLFLQFKVDGKVHTAAFTKEAGNARHGH